MSPKRSQNGVPRDGSILAKSGFLSDFQDFLKIDLAKMQQHNAGASSIR